jgi:hypothetical protein
VAGALDRPWDSVRATRIRSPNFLHIPPFGELSYVWIVALLKLDVARQLALVVALPLLMLSEANIID